MANTAFPQDGKQIALRTAHNRAVCVLPRFSILGRPAWYGKSSTLKSSDQCFAWPYWSQAAFGFTPCTCKPSKYSNVIHSCFLDQNGFTAERRVERSQKNQEHISIYHECNHLFHPSCSLKNFHNKAHHQNLGISTEMGGIACWCLIQQPQCFQHEQRCLFNAPSI